MKYKTNSMGRKWRGPSDTTLVWMTEQTEAVLTPKKYIYHLKCERITELNANPNCDFTLQLARACVTVLMYESTGYSTVSPLF